nr:transcription initiation factor IIA subunit 2 [Oncorhynchus nerka]
MAYQLYRNTTLGNSLQESLDELIQTQQITPQLALQVLLQFDKAINTALANRVRNRVNFKVRTGLCSLGSKGNEEETGLNLSNINSCFHGQNTTVCSCLD